jgi:hypothetical protein
MKNWMLAAAVMVLPGTALAQSTYVAGAIGAEVLRTTTVKATGVTFDSGSGETLSGSLRLGGSALNSSISVQARSKAT